MNETIKKFLVDSKITQEEYDILFFSKEDWFVLDGEGKQDWSSSNEQQIAFWKSIKKVKDFFENMPQNFQTPAIYDFSFIQFPPIAILNSDMMKIAWNNPLSKFLDNRNCINFYNATFYGDFFVFNSSFNISLNFEHCTFLGNTKFKDVTFNKKEVFKKAIFKQSIIFDNVNFKDITIFKGATFKKDITFKGITFNEWASFKDISSSKKLNFTYSRTKDFIDFSNSKIHCIDLEHTRFNSASFLNLNGLNTHEKTTQLNKSNFTNKESARLIKTHFEKENNITEANKYFQIEQDLYIKQLKTEKTPDKNKWKNLFVLYLNKYVSNFGTDWIRPLLVIFIFGYLASLGYGFIQEGTESINFTNSKLLLISAFLYSLLVYYFYHKKLWVAFTASILVFFSLLMGDVHLREISNDISKLINPLNIFKPKVNYFEKIAIYGMLVKLGMSVLIYQFIMAFRQNTRRK